VGDETRRLAAELQEVEEKLGDIDSALNRLDEGTYGTCQACGRVIADARLEVDPTIRWCGECQSTPDRSAQPGAGVEQAGAAPPLGAGPAGAASEQGGG